MKKLLYGVAAALLCTATAQAYTRQDFARQYKDTISIVETNYKHGMPVSGYERKQVFKSDFLMRAAEYGPKALLVKALSLATQPTQLFTADKLGRTALFYAANAEFADALINRFTALETARALKADHHAHDAAPAVSVMRFLEARDHEGATALMVLLRDGKSSAAIRLLRRGANPCVKDKDGVTPLHMAVIGANKGQVSNLIALRLVLQMCPKNVSAADKDGKIPLQWAQRNANPSAYKILKEATPAQRPNPAARWNNKLLAL